MSQPVFDWFEKYRYQTDTNTHPKYCEVGNKEFEAAAYYKARLHDFAKPAGSGAPDGLARLKAQWKAKHHGNE